MVGLNKYDDKKKREMRRKFREDKDFRHPRKSPTPPEEDTEESI